MGGFLYLNFKKRKERKAKCFSFFSWGWGINYLPSSNLVGSSFTLAIDSLVTA